MSKPEKYRIDSAYGNVYVWDDHHQAYVFYCKLCFFSEEGASDED
jgi:hypothetical protein